MSDGAGQCARCGRARWAGEQFCPGCGIEHLDTGSSTGLIDLDADVQEASGTASRASGRESLIGMAALAGILVVIALLFTLGNNAAEELTAPEGPEPTQTAIPTLAATPAPRATPVPTVNIPTTPRPGTVLATTTPVPPSDEITGLATALANLDMGPGWIIAINDPRTPTAINLETAETVSVRSPFLSPRTNVVLASPDGVYLPTGTGIVSTWTVVRWDGSEPATAARFDNADTPFGREPVWFFDDEDVGPVIVHLVGDRRLRLHALALATGESREVRLDDPIQVFLTGAVFDFAGLRTASDALLLDNGGSIWRWKFNDGWEAIAEGSVRLATGSSAVTISCEGPSACRTSLMDARTGTRITDLPDYPVNLDALLGWAAVVSPDHRFIANFSNNTTADFGRPGISIYETATGVTRRIGETDFNWWELIAWSPNSRYLLVNGEGGIAAIDVMTDEVHILSAHGSSAGPASSMQLAVLDTLNR